MTAAGDYYEILNEYQRRRDQAERLAIERRQEVYQRIPQIADIDKQIQHLGMRISKAVINRTVDGQKAVQALKAQLETLNKKKQQLLISAGYPQDYLIPQYSCRDCSDTGYIGAERCHCLKQAMIDRAYMRSNLVNLIRTENFDTFDITRYSDRPFAGEATTPRQNMQMIYAACLKFVENFDRSPENLLFYGSTGLGKTFLSVCIAKELLDRGKTVLYQTAFNVFDILREYKFNAGREDYAVRHLDMLLDVDLLIIDDLGTELNNSFISSELFNLLNARILAEKKTIISTNLTLEELSASYSERIMSRILGHYTIFKFFGDDIRKQLV